MEKHKLIKSLLLALGFSASAHAGGLLAPDNETRQDLTWLVNQEVIQLSLSTWPMSIDDVERALAKADTQVAGAEAVVNRVKKRITYLKSPVKASLYTSTSDSGLPHEFASSPKANHSLALALNSQGQWWDVTLQGNAEADRRVRNHSWANLDGSYAAAKFYNQWLMFGRIPQWWGPGFDGSLIRTDVARPVTGFLMQRADQSPFETKWLSWLGRWQYQLTAGQLAQYHSVPDAKLIGLRLTFNPFEFMEFGASRMMQWGGDGRPKSFNSFWDALLGDTDGTKVDRSNQLAGIDLNMPLRFLSIPMSLYGQLVGERIAGGLPTKNFFLVGFNGHHAVNNAIINWYIEGAKTHNQKDKGLFYTHHNYREGYYQQGYPLGHAIGGDGEIISTKVEYVTDTDYRYSARLLYAEVNPLDQKENVGFPVSEHIFGAELGLAGQLFTPDLKLKSTLWYNSSNQQSSDDIGLMVNFEYRFNY